jgi:hypothetical protein
MTLAAPALLGVTDAGENETDAPAGRPLALSVTGEVRGAPTEVRVRV